MSGSSVRNAPRKPSVIYAEHRLDPLYRQALIENVTGRAPLPEFEAPYGRQWGQYYNPKTKKFTKYDKKLLPIQGPPNYDQIWPTVNSIGDDWNRPIDPIKVPLLRDEIQYLQTASERLGRIRFIGQIGIGGAGVVWLVKTRRDKQPPELMACKVVAIKDLNYVSVVNMVECIIADTLHIKHLSQHPNICQTIDSVGIPDRQTGFPYSRICIFMEFCDTDLGKLLDNNANGMDEGLTIWWMRQIGSAIKFLHLKRVVHMDLKPGNILFNKRTQTAKLCDFGLSVAFPKQCVMGFDARVRIGTPEYWAPEMGGNYSFMAKPCDVFSLGMNVAESLMGTPVFETLSKVQVLLTATQWASGQQPFVQIVNPCSVAMGRLIQSMLTNDPNNRATITDVMANPLIR